MNRAPWIISPVIYALMVAMLPHLTRLPAWIVLWCALMWGYVLAAARQPKLPWPRPWLQLVLAFAGMAGVFATYGLAIGSDGFLGLLAVMAGVKPFEMTTHRHRMVTVFIAYFIVITTLFQSESLLTISYMGLSVWVTTAALIRINSGPGRLKPALGRAGVMMLQALPLVILLFLLFPRVQGSLFGLSRISTGTTGFSQTLSPGSVGGLLRNDEVAFRVRFDDPLPDQVKLYWRGIVFNAFDGESWYRAKSPAPVAPVTVPGETQDYTVTLAPHGSRWLFALDYPVSVPRWTRMMSDLTLVRFRPVTQTLTYRMTSQAPGLLGRAVHDLMARPIMPARGNPLSRNLARRISAGADTGQEKSRQLIAFFKSGDFSYTLEPPVLDGTDRVDAFLFDTRQGYCEHYASAFAFVMNAMGVPARIVGGYTGGEVNPYGDYMIVRQSMAHTWVEIWLPDSGWVRVDPTQAAAPEYIRTGQISFEGPGGADTTGTSLLVRLKLRWDAINTGWRSWFIGYTTGEQEKLLSKLGISGPKARIRAVQAGLIIGGILGMLIIYGGIHYRTIKKRLDPVAIAYRRLVSRLIKAGITIPSNMGPVALEQRVIEQRPDLAGSIRPVMARYIALRYRSHSRSGAEKEFIQAAGRFRPRKSRDRMPGRG